MLIKICTNYSFKVLEILDMNNEQSPLDHSEFYLLTIYDIEVETYGSLPHTFKAAFLKLMLFQDF